MSPYHPDLAAEELPRRSPTFQMLADVLVTGDPSRYQPTREPNTHWTNWLEGGTLWVDRMVVINRSKRFKIHFEELGALDRSVLNPRGLGRWPTGAAVWDWFLRVSQGDAAFISEGDRVFDVHAETAEAARLEDGAAAAILRDAEEYPDVAEKVWTQLVEAERLIQPDDWDRFTYDHGVPVEYVEVLWERRSRSFVPGAENP